MIPEKNLGHDSPSLLFYGKCPALQINTKCRIHAADILFQSLWKRMAWTKATLFNICYST